MELIENIKIAFSDINRPLSVVSNECPSTTEYKEASAFLGRTWEGINCDFLEKNSDGIYGLSPDAFLYYLPAILISVVNENRIELAVVDAIISMLDISNDSSSWDDYFKARFCILSRNQCAALQLWIVWLIDAGYNQVFGNELHRAYETLDIIYNMKS